MRLEAVWTSIVQVLNIFTLSSSGTGNVPQVPLKLPDDDVPVTTEPGITIDSDFVYHPSEPIRQDVHGNFFQGDTAMIQDFYSSEVYHPSDYHVVPMRTGGEERSYMIGDTPVVGTPKNPQEGVGGGLNCHYPTMRMLPSVWGFLKGSVTNIEVTEGWEPCFSPGNRRCWLKKGSQTIDINTNYEDPKAVPIGRVRKVRLAQGRNKTEGGGYAEAKLLVLP